MTDEHYLKLMQISNPKLHGFVADSINLCNPDSVYVITDSDADIAYARQSDGLGKLRKREAAEIYDNESKSQ